MKAETVLALTFFVNCMVFCTSLLVAVSSYSSLFAINAALISGIAMVGLCAVLIVSDFTS